MDIFSSVPEEIAKQVAVEWLTIVDVAKLDSAYLSHKARTRFHGLFASSHSEGVVGVGVYFKSTSSYLPYLAWLTRRECRVRNVHIPTKFVSDSELLTKFFQVCGPGLKRIELGQYDHKLCDDLAYESIVSHIAEHCHYLQELSLNDGFSENPDLLHQLSLRCPYINKLTFYYCLNYKGDLNKDLSFFALRTFEASHAVLSDPLMEAIAIGSANLQELRLDPCWGVSPEGLEIVAANCPLIHTVRLTHTRHEHVVAIVMFCKNLHTLEVICPEDTVTDDTLFAIAQHCPALRTLLLTKCLRITNVGIDEVLKKCRLREFKLDCRNT
eukprot:gene16732-19081_t